LALLIPEILARLRSPTNYEREFQPQRRDSREHHARGGGQPPTAAADYIDLYQIHGWDSNTPLEETLRTLDDLVRQAKVRYIGLSNFLSWQAATAVMLQDQLGLEKYVTAQMYYSLVGRGLEHEFQSFAEYHNIGILVWSPLAGGFLSGKYTRVLTLLRPAPASPKQAISCLSTERWATGS
jgi:diketogulonate reductase-like aldo/keto reductase